MRLKRPIQTRFRYGSPTRVNLATCHDSQAHSSKGTPSPHKKAPTDCKRSVSGTISLPSRGTFHHSLTVLVRYRSLGSIQAYTVVCADSHGISRAPSYSGAHSRRSHAFRLRDFHPLRSSFPGCSATRQLCNFAYPRQ